MTTAEITKQLKANANGLPFEVAKVTVNSTYMGDGWYFFTKDFPFPYVGVSAEMMAGLINEHLTGE